MKVDFYNCNMIQVAQHVDDDTQEGWLLELKHDYQVGQLVADDKHEGWLFEPGLGSRQIFFRLRILTFFSSGSGSWFFSQAAPAPAPAPGFFQVAPAPAPRSQKHPAPTGSGSWLLLKFAKIFFSPQTSKVKRQKNIKQVK